MPDYIALIRCKLSPDAVPALVGELHETLCEHDSSTVFLHGDGVDAMPAIVSAAPAPGIDWMVCRTSLARRAGTGKLPTPFRVATLLAFYAAALSAGRVDSLGLAGRLCCRPAPVGGTNDFTPRLLLEIGFAPLDQRQHRETLEMALGAAALEIDAAILFHGDGLAHLAGDAARSWSQVTDFGLLDIYIEISRRRFEPAIAARPVDSVGAARLRAGAANILVL